jgi:hypothetical protein
MPTTLRSWPTHPPSSPTGPLTRIGCSRSAGALPATAPESTPIPVGRLHQLRNRIAHHEPLLRRSAQTGMLSLTTQHLVDRHSDLLTVAELISPELRDYIAATSSVRNQIDQHPR